MLEVQGIWIRQLSATWGTRAWSIRVLLLGLDIHALSLSFG